MTELTIEQKQQLNEHAKRTRISLLDATTNELIDELDIRNIRAIRVPEYEWYEIGTHNEQWDTGIGPVRILVIK